MQWRVLLDVPSVDFESTDALVTGSYLLEEQPLLSRYVHFGTPSIRYKLL